MEKPNTEGAMQKIENLFLKIFRVVLVVVMGISLLSTVGFAITGLVNFTTTAKEPAPPKPAAEVKISVEDFIKEMTPLEKKPEQTDRPTPEVQHQQNKTTEMFKYLAEATKIFQCGLNLTSKAGFQAEGVSAAERERVETLRSNLQEWAEAKDWRGQLWVSDLVVFACAVTASDKVVALVKEGKKILMPAINFHAKAWDKIQKNKQEFEAEEERRMAKERLAEEVAVAASRAKGLFYLMVAGGAFGVFMLIALYLIFAKIEANLLLIHRGILGAIPVKSETEQK